MDRFNLKKKTEGFQVTESNSEVQEAVVFTSHVESAAIPPPEPLKSTVEGDSVVSTTEEQASK